MEVRKCGVRRDRGEVKEESRRGRTNNNEHEKIKKTNKYNKKKTTTTKETKKVQCESCKMQKCGEGSVVGWMKRMENGGRIERVPLLAFMRAVLYIYIYTNVCIYLSIDQLKGERERGGHQVFGYGVYLLGKTRPGKGENIHSCRRVSRYLVARKHIPRII
jgi:hypothetical protein